MYKIPKDAEIADAIRRVLAKHKEVRSQSLFHEFVLGELKGISPYYKASSDRIKRVASKEGVKIFIDKRKSQKEAKFCFVCGGELETLKVKNLLGSEVSAGKKCKVCGFAMDRGHLAPRRYIFYK
ncbi:hypothetical protein KKA03_00175 [archaeon]|nr:hypothetical protein [archaeon]